MQKKNESNTYIYLITVVAATGGLLFGYDTAVIAGTIGPLQTKFELSPLMQGWAASCALIGCAIGAMFAGGIADRYGRKKVMILSGFLFLFSAIGSAIPITFSHFVIARIIGGLGVGAASIISPLYISEVAPAKIRGSLVTLYQLAIVLGMLLIYFINMKVAGLGDETWNTNLGWRYMFGSEAIPAIMFLILLIFVPESPRWLAKEGNKKNSLKILEKINGEENARRVYNEIEEQLNEEEGSFSELFQPGFRLALIVGVMLAVFSQVTGINAIMYYAPEIFKSTGAGTDSALYQTVLIGLVNTVFTFVAIGLIDRLGRKILMLGGLVGMTLSLSVVGTIFYLDVNNPTLLLIGILCYTGSFAASMGPVTWVVISEIFPTRIRGVAMSIATLALWVSVFIVSQLFPILLKEVGAASTFFTFMVLSVIAILFIWRYVPETKGRTLEEIALSWIKEENIKE